MKNLISILMIICIALLAGCKSGLEKTLSIVDKIDEKYNNFTTSQISSESSSQTTTVVTVSSTRQTTIEIILNEPYYIKYNPEKEYIPMYEEADINSKLIKEFKPNGQNAIKVYVLSEEGDMLKVKYKNITGYMLKNNLDKKKKYAITEKTTTTSKITSKPIVTQWTSQYNQARIESYTQPKTTAADIQPKTKDANAIVVG